jgi:3-keto-disaccharide hydrolase
MPTPPLSPTRQMQALFLALALVATAQAQSEIPATRVPLENLGSFRSPPANWQLAGAIGGDPRTQKTITARVGSGLLVNTPTDNARGNLITAAEYGDLEVDLDFLMTPGSNSGVYLMGRYEVQLFDSWGVKSPTFSDCGGIYERWDEARGPGKQGYEGHAPLANASRAPGLW